MSFSFIINTFRELKSFLGNKALIKKVFACVNYIYFFTVILPFVSYLSSLWHRVDEIVHLRFKHAVLGTHFSYLDCLFRTVS